MPSYKSSSLDFHAQGSANTTRCVGQRLPLGMFGLRKFPLGLTRAYGHDLPAIAELFAEYDLCTVKPSTRAQPFVYKAFGTNVMFVPRFALTLRILCMNI